VVWQLREACLCKQVPVLYDKQTATIVSNESSDIIRMLATEFREFAAPKSPDLVPRKLARRIDGINGWVYDCINNGAYKAGFAKGQLAYDKAFDDYFVALDRVECLLDKHR
jgi:putative glutathione S-transferase